MLIPLYEPRILLGFNRATRGFTFDGVGREKRNISTLERVVAGEFIAATLRLRFAGE